MKIIPLIVGMAIGLSFLQHGCGNTNKSNQSANNNHNSVAVSANSTSIQKSTAPSLNESTESDNGATNSVAERMNESRERCLHTPVDKIDASPITGLAPLLVNFEGSKSYDPDGTKILKWEWQFGDGATALGEHATHVYDKPGIYTVNLIVTDEQGQRNFDCGGGTFGATITVK